MTDERKRAQYEMRAFFGQFDPWRSIMVAFTLGAAVIAVLVAFAMLIPARF